jgi:hypothetical protein
MRNGKSSEREVTIMTIKELYEMAKAKNMENADIVISASYDCGYCWAGGDVEEVTFDDKWNTVELANNNG